MKDRRRGFCFQTVEAMDAIRDTWDGEQLATAIALYQAMTDLANRHHRDGGRDGFQASRSEVGRYAGASVRTVDKYAQDFERLGLLSVRRETREDGLHLPNTWVLEDPEGGAAITPGVAQPLRQGGAAITPGVAQPLHGGGAARSTPLKEEELQEEEKTPPTPRERGERPLPPDGSRRRDQEHYREQLAAWAPHPANTVAAHLAQVWSGLDAKLRVAAPTVTYETHLAQLHLHRVDGDTLVLGCEASLLGWVGGHLRAQIEHAVGRPILPVPCGAVVT